MEGEKKAYQRTERRPGAELTPENKQLGQAKLQKRVVFKVRSILTKTKSILLLRAFWPPDKFT